MHALRTFVLILSVFRESDLLKHVDAMDDGPRFNEREIEAVSIVCGNDGRLDLANMLEEASDERRFVFLVKYHDRTLVLRLWGVFEVFDVFADNFTVRDQKALSINHVRNHHDLIALLIWKLQGRLGRFDIKCHDDWVSTLHTFSNACDVDLAVV